MPFNFQFSEHDADLVPFVIVQVVALAVFWVLFARFKLLDRLLRARLPNGSAAILAGFCAAAIAGCILSFGNKQFSGMDEALGADVGYRLSIGQLPYSDFICTLPPGFYLGAKAAIAMFGNNWNAQVAFFALFSAATFLWSYALLIRTTESRLVALLVAAAVQCAGAIVLSWWWYSATASICGTLFLLSCYLFLRDPRNGWIRGSLTASLFLLLPMKPNVALPLAAAGVLLVLCCMKWRDKLVLAGLSAISGGGVWLVFWLNHVSVNGVVRSYASVAGERGRLSLAVFKDLFFADFVSWGVGLLFLAIPFLILPKLLWRCIRKFKAASLPMVAIYLLPALGFVVGLYGMLTNMEMKEVDMPLIVTGGAMLLFARPTRWLWTRRAMRMPDIRRLSRRRGKGKGLSQRTERQPRSGAAATARMVYVSFLFSLMISCIYLGSARYRIRLADRTSFFMDEEKLVPPGIAYFDGFKGSTRLRTVMAQVGEVVARNPGKSFYFGPRMTFGYAAFQLAPTRSLPMWWHPGTSFARAEEGAILKRWQAQQFDVLIFLKHDATRYSNEFLALISANYLVDDRPSDLTVLYRKAP